MNLKIVHDSLENFTIAERIQAWQEKGFSKELDADFFQKMTFFMKTGVLDWESCKTGVKLVDLLTATGVTFSNNEAKKQLKNSSISVNNIKTSDANRIITLKDFFADSWLMLGMGKSVRFMVLSGVEDVKEEEQNKACEGLRS